MQIYASAAVVECMIKGEVQTSRAARRFARRRSLTVPSVEGSFGGTGAAYVPRTGWPAWAVLPATIAIGIVAMVLSAGASFLVAFLGAQSEADIHAAFLSPTSLVAGLLTAQIVMIALAMFAAGLFSSNRAEMLALRPPVGGWRMLPLALIPLFVVTGIWTAIVSMWRPDVVVEDLKLFKSLLEGPTAPFALLAIGVGAPLSEELLIRGFLFSGLAKSRLGLIGASIITTVLWTAVHGYSLFGLIEVMAIGLYLCWLLVRTGSLWVTIFCHAVYNTVVGVVLYFITLPPVPA